MTVAEIMSQENSNHQEDIVMPGFRFHPTEEELVEFYLRRKVEGKRFSVELITLLDLYSYDPWELPAMATIGEKEWFFYVPRDRKYRNGDRPNRVTTSGYWKATGTDKMIRADNFRAIGLKKTLVFYSGKAPKGVRTSWIMNEYRLPHQDTERLQKAEISLCRVHKRDGIEDRAFLPRSLPTGASSSTEAQSDKNQHDFASPVTEVFQTFTDEKLSETSGSSSTDVGVVSAQLTNSPSVLSALMEEHRMFLDQPEQSCSLLPSSTNIFPGPSFSQPSSANDFHWLVSYQQAMTNQQQQYQNHYNHAVQINTMQPQESLSLNSLQVPGFGRRWDWNSNTETSNAYTSTFQSN